ncbi:hypothetical protein GGI18_003934, partial [Coemansia linderi]
MVLQSTATTPNTTDTYRIPEPAFAEWAFYNIDYPRLASLALTDDCQCHLTLGTDTPPCTHCKEMVLAFNQELDK